MKPAHTRAQQPLCKINTANKARVGVTRKHDAYTRTVHTGKCNEPQANPHNARQRTTHTHMQPTCEDEGTTDNQFDPVFSFAQDGPELNE